MCVRGHRETHEGGFKSNIKTSGFLYKQLIHPAIGISGFDDGIQKFLLDRLRVQRANIAGADYRPIVVRLAGFVISEFPSMSGLFFPVAFISPGHVEVVEKAERPLDEVNAGDDEADHGSRQTT